MKKPTVPTTTFIHKASDLKLRFLLAATIWINPENQTPEKLLTEDLLKEENEDLLQTILDDVIIGFNGKPQKPAQRVIRQKKGDPLVVHHYGLVEIIPESDKEKAARKAAEEKKKEE